MRFLKKSLGRKIFFLFFIWILIVGGGVYYLYRTGEGMIPFYVFVGVVAASLLFLLLLLFFFFTRPFKVVMNEVQALLSGDSYKRIFTSRVDEVGILAHFFNQVTKGLAKASTNLKEGERMTEELNVAAQLQQDVLPKESIVVPGLQISAKNRAATEIGGDLFDFVTANDKTFIYVGDATGHGTAAGLIMTRVNALLNVFTDTYNTAYDLIFNINKYIKKKIFRPMYMTMVMLCWDHHEQKMTYVGAGHEHIIVYRILNNICDVFPSGGIALGMVPDNKKIIVEKEIPLSDGDVVVIFSDGITEARNISGELFGLERLKDAVLQYGGDGGAEKINYGISSNVSDFIKGHSQDDDMTLIVMKHDKTMTGKEVLADKSITWNG
jgi:serine phosphatase RsbU (regulator of sigma subunit)